LRPFISDYIVNIREAYINYNDLVIIYKQMDISF
jgi:hypothetical protein